MASNFVKVIVEKGGGEEVEVVVPKGITLAGAIEGGALKDAEGQSILINGTPAAMSNVLNEGDVISFVVKSAKQG